jgi:hypothetical protein
VKKLLIILILALPGAIFAQSLTISAKVRDAETRESLGFASVGIKGQPIGTISNGQGEFDFHFPLDMRNEILVVSMLGYKNFEAPVWTMLDNPNLILSLEKSPIILEEIVVSDTLTGGEVLSIALGRIEQNYPMKPFLLEGFYRDVKKVGGTYISLLEAAVQIYDENYIEPRNKNKLRESVKLVELRQSIGYESKFTTYFDQANLLEDLLLENSVRYRHIEANEEFLNSIVRDTNSFFNGHEIYALGRTDSETDLKLFVDKEDFSIVHLEYETKKPYLAEKKKNLYSKFMSSKKSIDYRRYDGKTYPSFMTMVTKVNWFDVATNDLKFETELFQQLLINKVNPNEEKRIGSTEKMRNYGLQYQDQPYNRKFWDNYNVIKETPLDKEIIADLEKSGPLEKQFADY